MNDILLVCLETTDSMHCVNFQCFSKKLNLMCSCAVCFLSRVDRMNSPSLCSLSLCSVLLVTLCLTYFNKLFAQVLTALPLSVHPAELVEAIWAVENYDPQYMRVIMYGMKTPLEFVNFRLLDEIVTAVFEERPRCANQFDIAVSHHANSIITVKVPACPPDGATSTWLGIKT